jgi:hypothetical protein
VFILCLSIANSSAVVAFDSTPPSLVSASVNTKSVPEEGGTVVLEVSVKTSSYDLVDNPLPVVNVNNKPFSCTGSDGLRMTLISGDRKNGNYRCNIIFTAPLKPGIYPLTIFPLTDKGGNTTNFINPNINITIGSPVITPTPTATPIQTITPKPTPTTSNVNDQLTIISELKSQINSLNIKISNLEAQLKSRDAAQNTLQKRLQKICSSKPKPKGC